MKPIFFLYLISLALAVYSSPNCQPVQSNQLQTCSMVSGLTLLDGFNSFQQLDSLIGVYINELESMGIISGTACIKAATLFICAVAFPQCDVLVENCTTANCKNTYQNCTYYLNGTCYDDTIIINGTVLQIIPPCQEICESAVSTCGIDPSAISEYECDATYIQRGPFGERIVVPVFPPQNSGFMCVSYNSDNGKSDNSKSHSNKSDFGKTKIMSVLTMAIAVAAYLFSR